MSQQNLEIDLIEKFLSGKLTPTEHQMVVDRMESDQAFFDQVMLHKGVEEIIKLRQEISLKNELEQIYKNTPYDFFSFVKIHLGKLVSIGLLLICSALILNLLLNKEPIVQSTGNLNADKPLQSSDTISTRINKFPGGQNESDLNGNKKVLTQVNNEVKNNLSGNDSSSVIVIDKIEINENSDIESLKAMNEIKKIETSKVPCSSYAFPSIEVEETCQNKSTGKIKLSSSSAFKVSVSDTLDFKGISTLLELEAMMYPIYVKFGDHCIIRKEIRVGSKFCTEKINASFAAELGERWEVPLPTSFSSGKFRVWNKAGMLVYEKLIYSENAFWEGQDNSGKILPVGTYFVSISGDDEKEWSRGTITIIK